MKKYIDFKTEKRKNAANDFEKDFFNTFTAKGFSETSPVMHLNKHIFRSQ